MHQLTRHYGENAKLTDSSQVISKVPLYTKKSFSVAMKTDKKFCSVIYKYKRGYGLQVESVKLTNEKIPKGLTLTLKMQSELIENNAPEEDFGFIKKFYKDEKLTPKWESVREKCLISAKLSFERGKFSSLKAGIEPTIKLQNFVTHLIHVPGLRGNPEHTSKIASSEYVYLGSFEKYVASIISNWEKFKTKYTQLKE